MNKKLAILSGLGLVFAPLVALAQQSGCDYAQPGTIEAVVCKIGDILNTVIPILIVLGIVFFVWGVVMYVMAKEEEAKKKGRNQMIFGIIGLVVIVAMWGLVGIVINTFDLSGALPVVPPTFPID